MKNASRYSFIFLALSALIESSFGFVNRQSKRINAIKRNIATNDIQHEKQFELTPPSKYPTSRGQTVDSRKIIATGAGRLHLTAVRLSHILFASEGLAEASLHELRKASLTFDDLARQISLCIETRDKGGSIGWVTIDD